MSIVLYTLPIEPPKPHKVVFFKPASNDKKYEDVTAQVVRLTIENAGQSADAPHELHRLDSSGKLVWKTKHPSLMETLWHAEWEYGVTKEAWLEKQTSQ